MKRSKVSSAALKATDITPDQAVTSPPNKMPIVPVKRRRLESAKVLAAAPGGGAVDYFAWLSLETICRILSYLPFYDVMKLECLCRRFSHAITLHLRLTDTLDFTAARLYAWMPARFNDHTFKRCVPNHACRAASPYSVTSKYKPAYSHLRSMGVSRCVF
jgi:hypothetical protein